MSLIQNTSPVQSSPVRIVIFVSPETEVSYVVVSCSDHHSPPKGYIVSWLVQYISCLSHVSLTNRDTLAPSKARLCCAYSANIYIYTLFHTCGTLPRWTRLWKIIEIVYLTDISLMMITLKIPLNLCIPVLLIFNVHFEFNFPIIHCRPVKCYFFYQSVT